MKNWKDINDECPRCGDIAQVLTSAKGDCFYEDDLAQCKDCGLEGRITINDEGSEELNTAYVNWGDFDDED